MRDINGYHDQPFAGQMSADRALHKVRRRSAERAGSIDIEWVGEL
ncbi:hypothetical protein KSB_02270 [Ktedonobacter robiniae]|uniref:Uncharacterized protein n=1 Tax=Ktedonobacter robiniae TaxID=2778365 RepID=A0ABQ3UGC6_9CHLR|nr:hypothetical protein KSB_02270 [Ktedonobacter robiniae]